MIYTKEAKIKKKRLSMLVGIAFNHSAKNSCGIYIHLHTSIIHYRLYPLFIDQPGSCSELNKKYIFTCLRRLYNFTDVQ